MLVLFVSKISSVTVDPLLCIFLTVNVALLDLSKLSLSLSLVYVLLFYPKGKEFTTIDLWDWWIEFFSDYYIKGYLFGYYELILEVYWFKWVLILGPILP